MSLEISRRARLNILNAANRVGGAHIGGAFSIVDFLVSFYLEQIKSLENKEGFYHGLFDPQVQLIFSKGHAYIAQLAVLDAIFEDNYYLSQYLKPNTYFFGHPKRAHHNSHFPVSTGSLSQGVTFGNGVALSEKIKNSKRKVVSIIGDGELNEGAAIESIVFANQKNLNHTFIVDYNNQMSLGRVDDIFDISPIFNLKFNELMISKINGHDFKMLDKLSALIFDEAYNGPKLVVLETIKGKGVSFMEGDFKWHHRRFKGDEYHNSVSEIKGLLNS